MRERTSRQRVSSATIARLHTYSRALEQLIRSDEATVSSERLGLLSGTTGMSVRSDLMTLGFGGIRGVGYDTELLLNGIGRVLGLQTTRDVVIVGAGRLGLALASYLTDGAEGLRVAAIYDADPAKVGAAVAGLAVRSSEHLAEEHLEGVLAVIATPSSAAQRTADSLIAAGVRALLNFAPVGLETPEGIIVRGVDVAGELYTLGYFHDHGRS